MGTPRIDGLPSNQDYETEWRWLQVLFVRRHRIYAPANIAHSEDDDRVKKAGQGVSQIDRYLKTHS